MSKQMPSTKSSSTTRPRKTSSKDTASKDTESRPSSRTSKSKPAESEKPKTDRRRTKKEEPVVEEVEDVVEDAPAEEAPRKRGRRVVTADEVDATFTNIITLLEEELDNVREQKKNAGGAKFIRSIKGQVRRLKADSARVAAKPKKAKGTRQANPNSGFNKPVPVSDDLADFLRKDCKCSDVKRGGEVSRNEVTKALCKYVKDKGLPDTKDGRQIHPDSKLQKLLDFDPDTSEHTLTYFYLQKLLRPHYIRPSTPESD